MAPKQVAKMRSLGIVLTYLGENQRPGSSRIGVSGKVTRFLEQHESKIVKKLQFGHINGTFCYLGVQVSRPLLVLLNLA